MPHLLPLVCAVHAFLVSSPPTTIIERIPPAIAYHQPLPLNTCEGTTCHKITSLTCTQNDLIWSCRVHAKGAAVFPKKPTVTCFGDETGCVHCDVHILTESETPVNPILVFLGTVILFFSFGPVAILFLLLPASDTYEKWDNC